MASFAPRILQQERMMNQGTYLRVHKLLGSTRLDCTAIGRSSLPHMVANENVCDKHTIG